MEQQILKLIKKYKTEMNEGVVMDDYDGGRVATLLTVIVDLERLFNDEG